MSIKGVSEMEGGYEMGNIKSHIFDVQREDIDLVIASREDNILFSSYLNWALNGELQQCERAVGSVHAIALMRDIWLSLYYGQNQVLVNEKNAMMYSIRHVIYMIFLEQKSVQNMMKQTEGNAEQSFLQALFIIQYGDLWVTKTLSEMDDSLEKYKLMINKPLSDFRETYDELAELTIPLPRHWVEAQAQVVKTLRHCAASQTNEINKILQYAINTSHRLAYLLDDKQLKHATVREELAYFYAEFQENTSPLS